MLSHLNVHFIFMGTRKFKDHTIAQYLDVLAQRVPVPGGGSAAALTAALGAALLSMAARYSLGRSSSLRAEQELKKILLETERLRKRLGTLVDLDAQAYLKVVKARKASAKKKKAALRAARAVPLEVCRICYRAVKLAPGLLRRGNPFLASDVEAAAEFLFAAFNAAKANVEINR